MDKHVPLDMDGKDLRIGDWVRVIAVPLSIKDLPGDTKDAFSRAVGNTFQIVDFDETGCIELEMWPKVSLDTIWLEPFCARRFRRYRQPSKSFLKMLESRSAPPPPRHKVDFDIRLKEGVDIEEFGHQLTCLGSGGGFACWPRDRRIKGAVYADKSEPDAIAMLERVRRTIADSEDIDSLEFGEITDADEA